MELCYHSYLRQVLAPIINTSLMLALCNVDVTFANKATFEIDFIAKCCYLKKTQVFGKRNITVQYYKQCSIIQAKKCKVQMNSTHLSLS